MPLNLSSNKSAHLKHYSKIVAKMITRASEELDHPNSCFMLLKKNLDKMLIFLSKYLTGDRIKEKERKELVSLEFRGTQVKAYLMHYELKYKRLNEILSMPIFDDAPLPDDKEVSIKMLFVDLLLQIEEKILDLK